MTENKKCPSCKTEIDKDAKKCPHCHADLRSWINRHPFITLLLVIFIGIPVIAGVFSGTSTSEKPKEQIPALTVEQKAEKQQELDKIKIKFNYEEDQFKKVGWYTHKDQTSQTRDLLRAYVKNDGYLYMESQYHASDWIFHTQVQVRIGDEVLTSEAVDTFNKDNETNVGGSGIYEHVSYLGGKDNGILKAIAESGDQKVQVRFEGRQNIHDFELDPKDKQAIKDAYRLSQLIKELNG